MSPLPEADSRENHPKNDPTKSRFASSFQLPRAPGYCRYDPTGEFLFIGCEESEFRIYNDNTGELTSQSGHNSWVRGFEFSNIDGSFVSAGYDGYLNWWKRQAGMPQLVERVRAHRGWIRSIALNRDQMTLASAGNDGAVRLWSMTDRQPIAELSGHEHPVCSLAFHPLEDRLVSADQIGRIKDWDTGSFRSVREFDGKTTYFYNKNNRGPSGGLRQLAFSPDGKELLGCGVVGGGDPLGQAVNPGAIVFDWSTGQQKTVLKAKGNELGVAWGMVYHPTAHFVAAISGGMSAKHVYFWNTTEEQPFHTIELPSSGRSIALHPTGTQFAIARHDGRIDNYRMD